MKRLWLVPTFVAALLCCVLVIEPEPVPGRRATWIPHPPSPEPGVDTWRAPDPLQQEVAWACEAVARVCGAEFRQVPSAVFCTTSEFVTAAMTAWVLRETRAGHAPTKRQKDAQRRIFGSIGEAAFAWYDDTQYVIYLLPSWAGPHDPDSVDARQFARLTLLHEATHALDQQVYPALFEVSLRATDGTLAAAQLVEAHAEYITERVAQACGWEEYYAVSASEMFMQAYGSGREGASRIWERAEKAGEGVALGRRLLIRAEELGGQELVGAALRYPPPLPLRTSVEIEEWLATPAGGVRVPDGRTR